MSKLPNVKISLFDILESSKNCLLFIESMDFDAFENDIKTQSAVLHQIMIIGEAVKRLGVEFTQKHPVLPWKEIAGTRDILIHHYEGTDLKLVWDIVNLNLPNVIEQIEKLLNNLPE